MKRCVWIWQLMGFAVTALGGTLLHFLYEWSGEAIWLAALSGVNESTWEHMKLLFIPMLIYTLIQYPAFREREDFLCIRLRGILLGLMLIPVIFYTYNGVIGHSPDWINIAIFFVAAAATYIYEARLLYRGTECCISPRLAMLLLIVIAALFVILTFYPPSLEIFRDPLTNTYGIPKG